MFFAARNLLFETGIREQEITVTHENDIPVFFQVSGNSALSFDPFAAAFYLVSRYEEYLPHIQDQWGRYHPHESLAYRNNFLQLPVVNIWGKMITALITQKFPDEKPKARKYNVQLTVDVDNAWAFRQKGLIRTAGGFLRDAFRLNFHEILLRFKVITGMTRDPFDCFEELLGIQRKYKLKPVYFFLVADYGPNDRNIPISSNRFQALIKSVADNAEIGVHPSFASASNPDMVREEINRLEQITRREVKKSRQHFLKILLPDTYTILPDLDIAHDYSMGYAAEIGFRAGICTPFKFYNLDREAEANLTVHPFGIMDATLRYYMKLNPEKAVEYLRPVIQNVQQVDGELCLLWHNETLSDYNRWKNWKPLLEETLQAAVLKTDE
ncbi:MAG: polysaccharide deacetylase family protein [Bacteroidetes bacterium]|nr:polysaccharide deacetylase family protein [Bacteroidota bacterium]